MTAPAVFGVSATSAYTACLYRIVGATVAVEAGVADGLSPLLDGFEAPAGAEGPAAGGAVACRVEAAPASALYGVESLALGHPVAHVLRAARDASALLLCDGSYRRLTLTGGDAVAREELLLAGVYSRLTVARRAVLLHGALVEVPGVGGLVFIGPSGVGKSTQAALWAAHAGGEIINGDKVFLTAERSKSPLAHGSPWRGSSPERLDRAVPLRAIVALSRGRMHRVRRVADDRSAAVCLPRVFLPGWDAALCAAVLDTVAAILPRVPLFEMSCAPDTSAVAMLREALEV